MIKITVILPVVILLMFITGCSLFTGPPEPTTITAGIASDEVALVTDGGTLREVTFYAESTPADTIYWQLDWRDLDLTIDYGVGEPSSYNGDYRLLVPLTYFSRLKFHLTFMAWGPKSDTARVTFINDR